MMLQTRAHLRLSLEVEQVDVSTELPLVGFKRVNGSRRYQADETRQCARCSGFERSAARTVPAMSSVSSVFAEKSTALMPALVLNVQCS